MSQSLLHRPSARNALHRTRLTEKLDRCLNSPLTIVSAPAGFGKSTLVSDWCDAIDRPVAWLSLDSITDDLGSFVQHFLAAVRRIDPGALPHLADMATLPSLPAPEVIAREMHSELDSLPRPIVVVFDDYQNITDPTVHQFVSDLLRDPSALVHLIILTRVEPPRSISSAQGHGEASQLRMADLAFTAEEIGQVAEIELGDLATSHSVAELATNSEGWPAGVRLGIEAIRQGTVERTDAGLFDRTAQEFLTREVLGHVPPAIRDQLANVSHLKLFSAPLCDSIATRSLTHGVPISGREFIAWLQDHNLFLVPLDNEGIWFRFHHVFAELLTRWRDAQGLTDRETERDLHRTASLVFEQQEMPLEALAASIIAEDGPNVARLAYGLGAPLADDGDNSSLARLLARIPPAIVDADPALLTLAAWTADMGWSQRRRSEEFAARAEAQRHSDVGTRSGSDEPTEGTLLLLRAHRAFVSGDMDAAAALSSDAATLLESTVGKRRVIATVQKVAALTAAGRVGEAKEAVESSVKDPRLAEAGWDPAALARVALAWRSCDLEPLERNGSRLLELGELAGTDANIIDGHYSLGIAAYERDRLAEAEHHLTLLTDRRFAARGPIAAHGLIALALTHLAAGRDTEVDAVMELLEQYVVDTQSESLQPLAEAARAHIDQRRDERMPALRWAKRAALDANRLEYMFFNPSAALVNVLLTSPDNADRGRRLLTSFLESAERQHHQPLTIRLLGLRAIDHLARGDIDAAVTDTGRAVGMSREGGAIRLLADLGPEIAAPLRELADADDSEGHTAAILAAMGQRSPTPESAEARRVEVAGHIFLTPRELEVLGLLAKRYSNKEIATVLSIAPATVKKHTVQLYEKLGVDGRREAERVALTEGYITN